MCTTKDHINMGFSPEPFPAGTHMCLIYSSEEERSKVISKYLESGIKSNEKVAYFADDMTPDEFSKWLNEKGVDTTNISNHDQFTVSSTASIYHPSGTFVPDEMILTLKNFYISAKEVDFPAVRVSGEMSWALKGVPGSDKLMEYESKVNNVVKEYPVTAICQYNTNKFDSKTILECLKVHPYTIVHGQIIRNPYYLSPEEYLQQK